MKIAIIEDDPNKRQQLRDVTVTVVPEACIVEARSFNSGRRLIVKERPDLVLLDMTMPMFDVTQKDKGGNLLGFAGRDVMEEITRLRIPARIIIVTQFDVFGEGAHKQTLEELNEELRASFPGCYQGTIYYHAALSNWKAALSEVLEAFVGEANDD